MPLLAGRSGLTGWARNRVRVFVGGKGETMFYFFSIVGFLVDEGYPNRLVINHSISSIVTPLPGEWYGMIPLLGVVCCVVTCMPTWQDISCM